MSKNANRAATNTREEPEPERDAALDLRRFFNVLPLERHEETRKTSISSNAMYHIIASHCVHEMCRKPYEFEQQPCLLEAEGQTLLNSHQDHIACHSMYHCGLVRCETMPAKMITYRFFFLRAYF